MHAASTTYRLGAVDDERRRREQAESARLLRIARESGDRLDTVTDKLRRMTAIYQEREYGLRKP